MPDLPFVNFAQQLYERWCHASGAPQPPWAILGEADKAAWHEVVTLALAEISAALEEREYDRASIWINHQLVRMARARAGT